MDSQPNQNSDLPITYGSLLDFPKDPGACMRKLHAEHGDIAALQDGDHKIVFVFSPEYNKQVLSDSRNYHSQFFAVRGGRRSAQRRVTSGLLTMNNDEHKEHRRLIMGPMQRKALPTYHNVICKITEKMLDTWTIGEVRDFDQEMVQFMLRMTSALLFGVEDAEFSYKIGAMIDRWVRMNHETGMGAFVSSPEFNDRYDKLLSMAEELEIDVQKMIALRRESDRPPTDVLALLMKAYESDGMDDAYLTGHITLLFGAAHLTTAHTFSWTLFLLAQHPEVMSQVFAEIEEHVTDDAPSFESLNNLEVLDRVIRESMRVLPASGYSQRINPVPVKLGPFSLSPGTPIIFSQFITHHRPDLFAEPDKFQPDRWKSISPSAYEFLPFGAGPRMCLGAPLAIMEIKIALAMILKRFKLSVLPHAEINGRIISTMLGPTSEVPMLVLPPDGDFCHVPVNGNIHGMVDLSHTMVDEERQAA